MPNKFRTLPEKEIRDWMCNYLRKKEGRPMSVSLFSELCGIKKRTLETIFNDGEMLSEVNQIRLSKAINDIESGNVSVMVNRDRTKFIEYRKQPRVVMRRSFQIVNQSGQIGLKIGLKNKSDYRSTKLLED